MSRFIKRFSDGVYMEYDRGGFDDWCVYIVKNGTRRAPYDADYFLKLKEFADKYGAEGVYADFASVYDRTGQTLDGTVLNEISVLSNKYGEDALIVDKVLTAFYATMVAEEGKERTKLGKRIKRLGVHCLLVEGQSVDRSTSFMKGMKWQEISALCEERGF